MQDLFFLRETRRVLFDLHFYNGQTNPNVFILHMKKRHKLKCSFHVHFIVKV